MRNTWLQCKPAGIIINRIPLACPNMQRFVNIPHRFKISDMHYTWLVMNVTKLLPACFDLHERSPNIIIHNLCFVCTLRVCVRVGPCSVARCSELRCVVRQRLPVSSTPSAPGVQEKGVWRPSRIPAPRLLRNSSLRHLKWPDRPGSPQQVV